MPPRTAADRFVVIINSLCQATAARVARSPYRPHGLAGSLIILIVTRLRRMAARFAALAALAAHVQAGTLPAPRHRKTGHCERSEEIAGRTPPPASLKDRLPTRFAWLIRLVPEAACPRSQFCYLLSDPEIAALLAAAPQMGRILRPLCRMLGIKLHPTMAPPALILPRRPRRKKPGIKLPSSFARSFSLSPGTERESSHAAPCAGPAADSESAALVEHILRCAGTEPATKPTRPRRRPPPGSEPAPLASASHHFKTA
jgi:hypothetical protein